MKVSSATFTDESNTEHFKYAFGYATAKFVHENPRYSHSQLEAFKQGFTEAWNTYAELITILTDKGM